MSQPQPQGFLAVPPGGNGGGVLVLHAWWGLNDTIRKTCAQLAEAGFVAYAPDLYRGKVATIIAEAEQLSSALDVQQARADITEAVKFLSERSAHSGQGLAVIGFSLGAYYALELSNTDPGHIRAVVVFYGTGHFEYSASKAEYLGHFAEADQYESDADVKGLEASLRRAGRPVTFYRYAGTGHWFFEPDRADAYHQAAATLSWDRTLAFLKKSLPPPSK
jgi:carboxymethylenebutenolidase